MRSVLIVGKVPPPLGGVTIYVSRLLAWLRKSDSSWTAEHYDTASENIVSLFKKIRGVDVVHINVSNSYLMLMISVIARLFFKPVLITYHGNVGRWGGLKNYLELLAMKISDKVLVLNSTSYKTVSASGVRVNKVSAFLPPAEKESLPDSLELKLRVFVGGDRGVFCTNASHLAYDSNGDEVYGITDLVEIFRRHPSKKLVISDPSATYQKYFYNSGIELPVNVMLIAHTHSFCAVLEHVDVMLRTTSTDGDSISIREGLSLGLRIIASDSVERPQGVEVYSLGKQQELEDLIRQDTLGLCIRQSPDTLGALLQTYEEISR